MTRTVVEFLDENMGQVGNNLEEGWGNLVEEYFMGDDVAALQVTVFSLFYILAQNITHKIVPIFDIMSKVAVGTILLLITLPYWLYHCIAGNSILC